tara:strand:+ start:4044 stop:4337 length:294 start_codon:yes stop_codon:yes gene_type:complete
MPGALDALRNMAEPKKVIPKVTIDGKVFEVSLELFKEIRKYGESQYFVKDDKIVMKPLPQATLKYSVLKKGERGVALLDGNRFWPTDVIEGGYEWTK